MKTRILLLAAAVPAFIGVAGCVKKGDITADAGIQAVRSACPTVGIVGDTGDVTLFAPGGGTTADAIDVVANITNVRSTCDDTGAEVNTQITFDVQARRSRADAPRTLTLPFFTTVIRGGTAVVAKRLGQVTLNFPAGAYRAQTQGEGFAIVSRAAATLPPEVLERLRRKRKPGDQDAAIDPLSVPENRQAVLRATFEALVGFQLTQDQLKYNATR